MGADLKHLLAERGIELKYIGGPTYTEQDAPGREIITNCDDFTRNLLKSSGFGAFHEVREASVDFAKTVASKVGAGELLGVGGGKALDVTKWVAATKERPFVAFPTAPTHDGLISRNCSLHNGVARVSIPAKYPRKIIIPLHLWKGSGDLKKAGICDVFSNIIALQDLSLAELKSTPVDPFYRNLSHSAVKCVLNLKDDRNLAEALILSGVSMENGSQYASGSEHETERLLEQIFGGKYLHGQLAGTGALISAMAYTRYFKKLPSGLTFDSKSLFEDLTRKMESCGVLNYALMPLKDPKFDPKVLRAVSAVRPERYTLWNELDSRKLEWKEIVEEIPSSCEIGN